MVTSKPLVYATSGKAQRLDDFLRTIAGLNLLDGANSNGLKSPVLQLARIICRHAASMSYVRLLNELINKCAKHVKLPSCILRASFFLRLFESRTKKETAIGPRPYR
jgi:hypothetical protein